MIKLGIDNLISNKSRRNRLKGARLALLGHPASVTRFGQHTLDALMLCDELHVVAAFGPQHGMRGDKQDNMIESEDYIDPKHNIPVFSLYGEQRYPTDAQLATFDVLLVDLQDIGTRIYTFVTTFAYMLDACATHRKAVWLLDRPNPAGRPIEGTILEPGWESYVGVAPMIMRHGMTLGEFARWYVNLKKLHVDLHVIRMSDYNPHAAPGHGWPLHEISWINPSPNAANVNMARCFPGTVLFEGTTLSEGRGTTRALEKTGAPDINFDRLLVRMYAMKPEWLRGCLIRHCFFEPTFHKHAGCLCAGLQIHTDNAAYQHQKFKPYRIAALILKCIRLEYPDYNLWRHFVYEYETKRLAIDLLSGGTFLREWVDDPRSTPDDLEERLEVDEKAWLDYREPFILY
ncbi:DUF1343 domain-containing protein [candidate division KSB1 bacterium]|nr:DUF1343 domain-containing protein [candidate division KSB1 bacterium]